MNSETTYQFNGKNAQNSKQKTSFLEKRGWLYAMVGITSVSIIIITTLFIVFYAKYINCMNTNNVELEESEETTDSVQETTVIPIDFNIVNRNAWEAEFPNENCVHLRLPVQFVSILSTQTESCFTSRACAQILKSIQKSHMATKKYSDIAYNFLVGKDGTIYEGRGWQCVGAHTKNKNTKSIGIALIGNTESSYGPAQIKAVKDLIAHGITYKFIVPDYSALYNSEVAKFFEE